MQQGAEEIRNVSKNLNELFEGMQLEQTVVPVPSVLGSPIVVGAWGGKDKEMENASNELSPKPNLELSATFGARGAERPSIIDLARFRQIKQKLMQFRQVKKSYTVPQALLKKARTSTKLRDCGAAKKGDSKKR